MSSLLSFRPRYISMRGVKAAPYTQASVSRWAAVQYNELPYGAEHKRVPRSKHQTIYPTKGGSSIGDALVRKDRFKATAAKCNRHVSGQRRTYSTFKHKDVIVRDVCIIGGGSTGTFSAIRLRDQGKSVIVVEQEDRLGGHTITYQDPATGLKTEAGLVVIRDSTVAQEYFARFDIPLIKFDPPPPDTTMFVDFTTGKQVDFTPEDSTEAFRAYAVQLAKYPFLDDGFDLPDPIPADLLLPFGTFVKKYNLSPIVPIAFKLGQGLGDLLSQPTLYVMKNFGSTALQGIAKGFLATAKGDNSELYVKALAELRSDVLLNTRVISTLRDCNSVKILVQTPSGQKLIESKKLLITIPPKLENLEGFDLDAKERSILCQFSNSAYWTFLLRNTGIPDNHCLINTAEDKDESLPSLPGIYEVTPTGIPNLVNLKYGSPIPLPGRLVKADVLSSIARLQIPGILPSVTPEIVLFASHTPFELTVPESAITSGFYKQLNALHGYNNTFYTGAAFQAHDASLLWQYSDKIICKLLRELRGYQKREK